MDYNISALFVGKAGITGRLLLRHLGTSCAKDEKYFEPGDVEEALNAASMIGDDRLQKQSRGYVTPDSFTHGTSAQRVTWFNLGF